MKWFTIHRQQNSDQSMTFLSFFVCLRLYNYYNWTKPLKDPYHKWSWKIFFLKQDSNSKIKVYHLLHRYKLSRQNSLDFWLILGLRKVRKKIFSISIKLQWIKTGVIKLHERDWVNYKSENQAYSSIIMIIADINHY